MSDNNKEIIKDEWFFNPLDYGFKYDENKNCFIKEIKAVNQAVLKTFQMSTKEREVNKNWFFETKDRITQTNSSCLYLKINKDYIESEFLKYGVIEKKDENFINDFPEIKPPLGLKPRNIFEKQMKENIHFNNKTRLFEILEASLRYLENNLQIPQEWLSEALRINLDLDLSILKPENLEEDFNPCDFGFIFVTVNPCHKWQKINKTGTFYIYKLQDSFYKLETLPNNGFPITYNDLLIGSNHVAKGFFEDIGALND